MTDEEIEKEIEEMMAAKSNYRAYLISEIPNLNTATLIDMVPKLEQEIKALSVTMILSEDPGNAASSQKVKLLFLEEINDELKKRAKNDP